MADSVGAGADSWVAEAHADRIASYMCNGFLKFVKRKKWKLSVVSIFNTAFTCNTQRWNTCFCCSISWDTCFLQRKLGLRSSTKQQYDSNTVSTDSQNKHCTFSVDESDSWDKEWYDVTYTSSFQEQFLWYFPCLAEHYSQTNSREHVGVVALSWTVHLIRDSDWIKRTATGKYAPTLHITTDEWLTLQCRNTAHNSQHNSLWSSASTPQSINQSISLFTQNVVCKVNKYRTW